MDDKRHALSNNADKAHAGEQVMLASGGPEMDQRVRHLEAALDTLRARTTSLERETAMIRADLERLRQESERAAGSKLP